MVKALCQLSDKHPQNSAHMPWWNQDTTIRRKWIGRCWAHRWLLLGRGKSPSLVTQGVLQHPQPQLSFTLLQPGAGSWGQAPFENHRCLCCCMKVLHMLSSQWAIHSGRTCCLSTVQNVCSVPSSESNINSTPFPHYFLNRFSLVNLHHSTRVALDSVRVCKCRAL